MQGKYTIVPWSLWVCNRCLRFKMFFFWFCNIPFVKRSFCGDCVQGYMRQVKPRRGKHSAANVTVSSFVIFIPRYTKFANEWIVSIYSWLYSSSLLEKQLCMRTPIPGWQKLTNINASFFDFLRGHSFLQLRSGIYKLASYDTCFLAFPIQSFKHIHGKYGRCIIFEHFQTTWQYFRYIYI